MFSLQLCVFIVLSALCPLFFFLFSHLVFATTAPCLCLISPLSSFLGISRACISSTTFCFLPYFHSVLSPLFPPLLFIRHPLRLSEIPLPSPFLGIRYFVSLHSSIPFTLFSSFFCILSPFPFLLVSWYPVCVYPSGFTLLLIFSSLHTLLSLFHPLHLSHYPLRT